MDALIAAFVEPAYVVLLAIYAHVQILLPDPRPLSSLVPRSEANFHRLLNATFHPDARTQIAHLTRGTVVDVGPGLGSRLSAFSEPVQNGRVTKIYGFEPNIQCHQGLKANLEATGLSEVYEIVPLCVEDLEEFLESRCGDKGASRGIGGYADTAVCIHVLCCVAEPEQAIQTIYEGLSKDGGQSLLWEHISCRKRLFGRFEQCTLCADLLSISYIRSLSMKSS